MTFVELQNDDIRALSTFVRTAHNIGAGSEFRHRLERIDAALQAALSAERRCDHEAFAGLSEKEADLLFLISEEANIPLYGAQTVAEAIKTELGRERDRGRWEND